MNAGVPLKPVFATVSIRFSFRATPTVRTRLKDPFHHSTGLRMSVRTEVADADLQVAVQLFEQNVERLDVAVNDLSSHIVKVLPRSSSSETTEAVATDTGTASSRRWREGVKVESDCGAKVAARGTQAHMVLVHYS
jgi:hypothetical protein